MTIREPLTILVVDDEDSHLAIIRKILEEEKYSVQTCSSSHQALRRLRESRYDAILCDMWLPEITGMGLYQMVQEEFPQYERRFIVITADTASDMTMEFIRTRNLPYVIKPFSPTELVEKMREVLGGRLTTDSEVSRDEINNRRERRVAIQSQVRVRHQKWETGGPDAAFLVDISRRGVRFFTSRRYWIGAQVLVTYPVSDPGSLEQEGNVVRIEELQDGFRRVAVALNIGRTSVAEEKRTRHGRRAGERRRSNLAYAGLERRRMEDRRFRVERRMIRATVSR